ncbi:type III PLP-dependent enzyme [Solihabitans fulvus]|uniref:ornithine decarboxylase n=1 Tax=Solihabitans fulvus TaxID=1892852 RepID=A0A5B2X6L5_9PSEU|nr:type III PLP-dependent enzyme [Solihabitans fulvus]KAA2258845.1 type III PLP-dependent enzyme [Solihabitans fulvus]
MTSTTTDDRATVTSVQLTQGTEAPSVSDRVRRFLAETPPPTPCLVIDLETVRRRFAEVSSALPEAGIYYAVKANPAPEVVRALAALGCSFDVASPAEIDLCLAEGAAPETISYSNPIKKAAQVAYAYARGVRMYACDSEADLDNLAAHAPGSSVFCRTLLRDKGSIYPFGRKFGCEPEMVVELLARAVELGLDASGVSFHVGSQQLDPAGWDSGIATAAEIAAALRDRGVELTSLNLGGGLPASYRTQAPPLAEYGAAIRAAVARSFGEHRPRLMIEPGRSIVGEAGVLRSEVVLVSRKSYRDDTRWVFLDVGKYGGLVETEGEAIAYPVLTSRDGGPTGPVVLAGPTCDGDDVLYQHTHYELPLDLAAGDHVDILSTGAYTASYSSVEFNGFEPLRTYCVDGAE